MLELHREENVTKLMIPMLFVAFILEYNISAAAISIFSLAFMILGSLCLVGSCSGKGKRRDYLLKPAGMFYAFAGECSCVSVSAGLTSCAFGLMFTHLSAPQASVPSSHWRWCDSQSNAWLRAKTPSGLNIRIPGPSPAPALASSCSFLLASPSWSSPCPRCPGIHGRLAWTLSRIKRSETAKPTDECRMSGVFCSEYRCRERQNWPLKG